MNFFEILIFNLIIIIGPLLLHLFCIAYDKNIKKNINSIFFNITLLTIIYFIIKFNHNTDIILNLLFIIPLSVAYIRSDKVSIILLSSIEVLSLNYFYNSNIYILIYLYVLFYLISLIVDKKKIFICLLFTEFIYIIMYKYPSINKIFEILVIVFFIYLIYKFIIILMDKGEKLLNYHLSIKELEREKQVRNSLFKIAHEIKNPMAVCKGYFDMLDVNNYEQVKKYLPIIKEEIDHTLIILQDFLSITKVKIEKDLMDINMLVEDVMNSFEQIFKSKKITYNFDIIDEEVYINGDYNRLKQVLINILKNSIESLDEKEMSTKQIDIYTKYDGNNYQIVVKDNGIGMSKEVLSRLAEPFFTTKKNGTGLGLALSKEIVSAHKGTIEYESRTNIGTAVIITIPIEKNAL